MGSVAIVTNPSTSCSMMGEDIHYANVAGATKMIVVIDTQWALWDGRLQKSWLPWFNAKWMASDEYFEKNGESLFSSHSSPMRSPLAGLA